MRRVGLAITLALGMVFASVTPSWADPSPSPTASGPKIPVPAAQKPDTVCTIGSGGNGAVHVTGLVATSNGYVVVDGANTDWPSKRVVYLDSSCVRTSLRSYGGGGAADPQDLAIDSKGVLWVADTGDDPSAPSRSSVALWKVPTGTAPMTLYRFSYPDGPQNAEALLLSGDGTPIFVTKNATGPASLYAPDTTMSAGATTPLKKVGEFSPDQTGTATKFGLSGQNWVTGGANSPDGKRVVLRTYSDAYEWTVTNGDVITAITTGTPRITRLPDDTQGESIAYTPDGTSFLTVSNTSEAAPIYKWRPAAAVVLIKAHKASKPSQPGFLRRWFNSLSLTELMTILGGIAVFGLLLVIIGILGIRRSRAAARAAAARAARDRASRPDVARASVPSGSAGVAGPGVYGGSGVHGGSGVYGAPRESAGNFYPEYPEHGDNARPPSGYGPYGGAYPGGDYPAAGRYAADPYADPYAAPDPRPPANPHAGQYPGDQYPGGTYPGGQYVAPVDPYDDGSRAAYPVPHDYGTPGGPRPPAEKPRPRPAGHYPEEHDGYGDYRA